jgi:O-antigen/teichoic acid export membrane protein
LLTLPLVARLYLPADLGKFGAFGAFMGTASAITALRYDVMIVAAVSRRDAAAVLAVACLLTAPLSLLCTILFGWLIMTDSLGFGILPIEATLWMLPALVATQLFFTMRYWLMRENDFRTIAKVTVWQGLVRAFAPIAVVALTSGWLGLVSSEVASRVAGLRAVIRTSGRELERALSELKGGDIRRAFRAYPDSLLAGTPSALINTASNYLPLPLLAGMYGATAAGYFALAQRAIQLPIGLITRNVADVFHARLVEHARIGPDPARRLFWRTGAALLLVGGVPSLFVAVLAHPLVALFLGARWNPAAELLVAMTPWALATFVVSPLSRAVVVYRGQGMKLLYDSVSLVAVWAVFKLARSEGWQVTHTVWILSWTQSGTYVAYMGILMRLLKRGLPGSPTLEAPLAPTSGDAA